MVRIVEDGTVELSIDHIWDGALAPPSERAQLRVANSGEFVHVTVHAPFFGDPPPDAGPGPYWGLWEYEVVELFVVGAGDAYTEVELGPHGHHLILRFTERRVPCERELRIDYEAEISSGFWRASARIPCSYFPRGPHRANAYAIHGQSGARRYLAHRPVPGPNPDFHRLEFFPPVTFPGLL